MHPTTGAHLAVRLPPAPQQESAHRVCAAGLRRPRISDGTGPHASRYPHRMPWARTGDDRTPSAAQRSAPADPATGGESRPHRPTRATLTARLCGPPAGRTCPRPGIMRCHKLISGEMRVPSDEQLDGDGPRVADTHQPLIRRWGRKVQRQKSRPEQVAQWATTPTGISPSCLSIRPLRMTRVDATSD